MNRELSPDTTLSHYRENAKGDSFDNTSSNEGLGDVPIYAILNGKNPFFEVEIEVGTQDEIEEAKKALTLGCESGWIENKRAYVPAGARSRRQAYRVTSAALLRKRCSRLHKPAASLDPTMASLDPTLWKNAARHWNSTSQFNRCF